MDMSSSTAQSPQHEKPTAGRSGSIWRTLRHDVFRAIWIASLTSQIGSWMQNLGAQWLMTTLSDSPLMVGLVQTATMLPGVGLALLAGALADMMDRRRYMILVLSWAAIAASALAVLTYLNLVSPIVLLIFVFAVGLANAALIPAMSATLQDIVPREEILNAVTLNSLSINVSRLVGPAIAGLLIGLYGTSSAFLLNAISFVVFLIVIIRWSGPPRRSGQPASLISSVMGGLDYARRSSRFKALITRSSGFFLTGSATMALLPLFARTKLGLDAQQFGLMLGAMGIGAIMVAVFGMARLSSRFSRDTIVLCASLLTATSMIALSQTTTLPFAAGCMVLFGASWITCLVSFQVSNQMLLPAWVRARGLSISVMAHMGCMAVSGVIWGFLGRQTSLESALMTAGISVIVISLLTSRLSVRHNEPDDAQEP